MDLELDEFGPDPNGGPFRHSSPEIEKRCRKCHPENFPAPAPAPAPAPPAEPPYLTLSKAVSGAVFSLTLSDVMGAVKKTMTGPCIHGARSEKTCAYCAAQRRAIEEARKEIK